MPKLDRKDGSVRGIIFTRQELDVIDRALCLAAAAMQDDLTYEHSPRLRADFVKQRNQFRALMEWVGENKLNIDR